MADDETMEVDEEAPRPRMSKMSWLIIAFSAVLGVLFLALIGGGLYFAKKTGALQNEVTAFKKEIKELKGRAQLADDIPAQIAALKREVETVKTELGAHLVAEAAKAQAAEKEAKEKAAQKEAKEKAEAKSSVSARGASEKAPAKESVKDPKAASAPVDAGKSKRPVSESFSCDISGKSPEEQAAILKRCVSVMDAPPPPPRGKAPGR